MAQLDGRILVLCPLATQSHGGGSVCSLRGSARGLDDFELVMLRALAAAACVGFPVVNVGKC